MVKIAHIEKFVKDNPERFPGERGKEVLASAHSFGQDPITSLNAKEVLGSDSEALFRLIITDPYYVRLCF